MAFNSVVNDAAAFCPAFKDADSMTIRPLQHLVDIKDLTAAEIKQLSAEGDNENLPEMSFNSVVNDAATFCSAFKEVDSMTIRPLQHLVDIKDLKAAEIKQLSAEGDEENLPELFTHVVCRRLNPDVHPAVGAEKETHSVPKLITHFVSGRLHPDVHPLSVRHVEDEEQPLPEIPDAPQEPEEQGKEKEVVEENPDEDILKEIPKVRPPTYKGANFSVAASGKFWVKRGLQGVNETTSVPLDTNSRKLRRRYMILRKRILHLKRSRGKERALRQFYHLNVNPFESLAAIESIQYVEEKDDASVKIESPMPTRKSVDVVDGVDEEVIEDIDERAEREIPKVYPPNAKNALFRLNASGRFWLYRDLQGVNEATGVRLITDSPTLRRRWLTFLHRLKHERKYRGKKILDLKYSMNVRVAETSANVDCIIFDEVAKETGRKPRVLARYLYPS